ncbi:MAG: 30S ribosomal protein S2 [Planctomycetes bacterium]|nr:30S ribosomal protein S2 [Planctomycetota bacterium]
MADSLVRQLLEAGVHFGHKAANWNPKMGAYIFGKKNGIHIIDVRATIKGLLLAKRFLTRTVAGGKDILFVGTKRQAKGTIETVCTEVGQPFVTERWLGGTLTNFRTIRSRLKRLEELETLMNSEEWTTYSKKMASQLTRERRKIARNLSGIRGMNQLPGAMVVIDVRREVNALREATKLGIPTVCLIDTDSDPDLSDLPIPGNDDAMRGIEIIMRELGAAVTEGKGARAVQEASRKGGDDSAPQRRRSSRSQFRAEEQTPAADADVAAGASVEEGAEVEAHEHAGNGAAE